MATKFLVLSTVAVVFILSSTAVGSFEVCTDPSSLLKNECKTCNFLTFGQEKDNTGLLSYSCPTLGNPDAKYCCYGPLRNPFCCGILAYLVSGFAWVFAVILVIGGVFRLIKLFLC